MVEYNLPETIRKRADAFASRSVIAGIRPEHFADVTHAGRAQQADGVSFGARVDRLEWLGSELFVHFSVPKARSDGFSSGLREVATELGEAGIRGEQDELLVARIDPASDISEGDEVEFRLDTTRIHYSMPRPARTSCTRWTSCRRRRWRLRAASPRRRHRPAEPPPSPRVRAPLWTLTANRGRRS